MKPAALFGIGACAAACAGIAIWPLVAGAGLAGFGAAGLFGGMSAEVVACLAIPAAGLAGWMVWRQHKRSHPANSANADSCTTDGSCGCAGSRANNP